MRLILSVVLLFVGLMGITDLSGLTNPGSPRRYAYLLAVVPWIVTASVVISNYHKNGGYYRPTAGFIMRAIFFGVLTVGLLFWSEVDWSKVWPFIIVAVGVILLALSRDDRP